MTVQRCAWAATNPLETEHHDKEWGVPVHDDRQLFEMLVLESAQSGLSWATILAKRAGYARAFDNFDASAIARYPAAKVETLLADPGIVRHRLKIAATINNAQQFLAVQREHGSFDAYLWSFVDGQPINNRWRSAEQVPSCAPAAERLSKALKQRGFKFLGPTTCYAYMQAVGMVNDHTLDCFRYREILALQGGA